MTVKAKLNTNKKESHCFHIMPPRLRSICPSVIVLATHASCFSPRPRLGNKMSRHLCYGENCNIYEVFLSA